MKNELYKDIEEKYSKTIDSFDPHIKKIKITLSLWFLFSPLAFGTIYLIFFEYIEANMQYLFFLIWIYFVVGIIKTGLVWAKYKKVFKKDLVSKLINNMDLNLQYRPESGLSSSEFNNLKIFSSSNRYTSEDLIEGNLNGVDFINCDIHAQKTSGSGKKKKTITIFNGEVFVFTFKEKFKSPLYIKPDFAEKSFGIFGKFLQKNNPFSEADLITMDSVEFEKHYKVLSDDPINARYVLTPKTMEKFLELGDLYKHKLYIECKNYKMYLLIYHRKDRFEPTIKKDKIVVNIAKHIDDLNLVLDSIKTLELEMHHINLNA